MTIMSRSSTILTGISPSRASCPVGKEAVPLGPRYNEKLSNATQIPYAPTQPAGFCFINEIIGLGLLRLMILGVAAKVVPGDRVCLRQRNKTVMV